MFDEPSPQEWAAEKPLTAVWHASIGNDPASTFIADVTERVSGGDFDKAEAFAKHSEAMMLRRYPQIARYQAQQRTQALAGFLQSIVHLIGGK